MHFCFAFDADRLPLLQPTPERDLAESGGTRLVARADCVSSASFVPSYAPPPSRETLQVLCVDKLIGTTDRAELPLPPSAEFVRGTNAEIPYFFIITTDSISAQHYISLVTMPRKQTPPPPCPSATRFPGAQVRDLAVYLLLDLPPVHPARHPGKNSLEWPPRDLVLGAGGSEAVGRVGRRGPRRRGVQGKLATAAQVQV